jgi:hypothetical protein
VGVLYESKLMVSGGGFTVGLIVSRESSVHEGGGIQFLCRDSIYIYLCAPQGTIYVRSMCRKKF